MSCTFINIYPDGLFQKEMQIRITVQCDLCKRINEHGLSFDLVGDLILIDQTKLGKRTCNNLHCPGKYRLNIPPNAFPPDEFPFIKFI